MIYRQKQSPGMFCTLGGLKYLQNSQENTYVGVFLIEHLQWLPLYRLESKFIIDLTALFEIFQSYMKHA